MAVASRAKLSLVGFPWQYVTFSVSPWEIRHAMGGRMVWDRPKPNAANIGTERNDGRDLPASKEVWRARMYDYP